MAPTVQQKSYQQPYRPPTMAKDTNHPMAWARLVDLVDIHPKYFTQTGPPIEEISFTEPAQKKQEKDISKGKGGSGKGQQVPPQPPKVILPPLVVNVAARPKPKSPYQPFEEPGRSDEFYKKYLQLSQNVAHKYPNPGEPTARVGRVGANWRHIKQVLNNTGSQVCFVDGLVRLYDTDKKNGFPRSHIRMSSSRHVPLYAPVNGDLTLRDTDALSRRDMNPATQMPGSPSKYKGFYTTRD